MTSVSFHKELYSLEALRQGVRDFSGIFDARIVRRPDYYEVIFQKVSHSHSEPLVKGEFANYVLMLTKSLHT